MVEIMHLPTIEACNEYGLARYPQGYNFQNKPDDNEPVQVPDFLRGGQFTLNSPSPYINSLKSERFDSVVEEYSGMDEVIIDVLSNTPYIPKIQRITKTDPISGKTIQENFETYEGGDESKIFTIRIAPEWEDISIEKSHKWDVPGGTLSNLVKDVSETAFLLDDIRTTVQNMRQNNKLQTHFTKQMHIRNEYQETEKEEIEIPFTLFTKTDFIRDIFYPLMFITSLSYPRRLESSVLVDKFKELLERDTKKRDTKKRDTEKKDNEEPNFDFKNLFKIYTPYITSPPRYLRVKHSSGLFEYNHMVITDFTYDFERPFFNIKDDTIQHFSFPLKVDCTLKLKSMDYLMGGDYFKMMLNQGASKIQVINEEEEIRRDPENLDIHLPNLDQRQIISVRSPTMTELSERRENYRRARR